LGNDHCLVMMRCITGFGQKETFNSNKNSYQVRRMLNGYAGLCLVTPAASFLLDSFAGTACFPG
jgi:hypothetical protein